MQFEKFFLSLHHKLFLVVVDVVVSNAFLSAVI